MKKPGEIQDDRPALPGYESGNAFPVPEGYFENLEDRIEARLKATERKRTDGRRRGLHPVFYAAAAVAIILITVSVFLAIEHRKGETNLFSQHQKPKKELNAKPAPLAIEGDSARTSRIHSKEQPAVIDTSRGNVTTGTQKAGIKQDVLQNLDKEGITDEDILDYLLLEDFDPIDLQY